MIKISTEFNELRVYRTNSEDVKDFLENKVNYFLISMPKLKDGKDYQKAFAECLVNELVSLTHSMSKNAKTTDYMKHPADVLNENDIPLEMMHQFRAVAETMQYMINCFSWNAESGYKNFDAAEIKSRLERAGTMSNIALSR